MNIELLNTLKKVSKGLKTLISGNYAHLENGKVPASQLPSYVDDVIEGYYSEGAFYEDSVHTTVITAETGKIYVDLTEGNNDSYRYSGTAYIKIASPIDYDSTPVENSTKVVTSGGLYTKFSEYTPTNEMKQADFGQNDSTQQDFIKNRTHFDEGEDVQFEYFATTLTEGSNNYKEFTVEVDERPSLGHNVIINNTKYGYIMGGGQQYSSGFSFGITSGPLANTVVGSVTVSYPEGGPITVKVDYRNYDGTMYEGTSLYVKFYSEEDSFVKKLDEKYIPDSCVTFETTGKLSDLSTNTQETIVAAINELKDGSITYPVVSDIATSVDILPGQMVYAPNAQNVNISLEGEVASQKNIWEAVLVGQTAMSIYCLNSTIKWNMNPASMTYGEYYLVKIQGDSTNGLIGTIFNVNNEITPLIPIVTFEKTIDFDLTSTNDTYSVKPLIELGEVIDGHTVVAGDHFMINAIAMEVTSGTLVESSSSKSYISIISSDINEYNNIRLDVGTFNQTDWETYILPHLNQYGTDNKGKLYAIYKNTTTADGDMPYAKILSDLPVDYADGYIPSGDWDAEIGEVFEGASINCNYFWLRLRNYAVNEGGTLQVKVNVSIIE